MKKKVFKLIQTGFLIVVITFLLLETTLAIYIHYAQIRIELPTYTLRNTQGFWFDLDKNFGTLHLPNDSYRQKKYCFDVVYNTNSKGFRDIERQQNASSNRVVALGDSFTEGIGVDVDNRLTNLLESNTEIPHLNFGLAGNFGPTQYMILYKTLAKNYSHDAILIGILPANDFIDDDYEVSKKVSDDRYRPFLTGDYPNYDLVYHIEDINKSKARPRQQSFKGKILKNFTYTYNLFSYFRAVNKVKAIPKGKRIDVSEVPSYFNFTEEHINRMRYSIERIKLIAGKRQVMVYSIPSLIELKDYKKHKNNPLGPKLKAICNAINVEYLDLLPLASKLSATKQNELYLPCDGHWSKKGNNFAKEAIYNHFSYYKK